MKGQYEQQCNAVALKLLGIPVLKNIKPKQYKKVKAWMESDAKLTLDFPDETEWIIEQIIEAETAREPDVKVPETSLSSAGKFRDFLLKKIFYGAGS